MAVRTTVEWRKGETGLGGTYTFNPKPKITFPFPSQRLNQIEIPKLDGGIIQTLGLSIRRIDVEGVVYVVRSNYDNLKDLRDNLNSGIGTGVGQLHIVSNFAQVNSKHVYYKGILGGDIQWTPQENMSYFDYKFSIICADPVEYTVP